MSAALRTALQKADEARIALGHFNVSELVAVKAIVHAARALDVPVIIGVSEGERDFFGVEQVAALVRSYRAEGGPPIFLDADHTHSLAAAERAVRAGFDAVVFDASSERFDENVAHTRAAVAALRTIDPDVVVEGEIGYIGSSSAIHDAAPPQGYGLTTVDEARRFVDATGIDVLAPSLGTMHGMLRSMLRGDVEKRLNLERIAEIKAATRKPLTLHGGSGTHPDDVRRAVRAGVTIVHVNTELRVAWRRGLDRTLADHPDEVAPYKVLAPVEAAIQAVVTEHLQLLNHPG
jgi:fructose-bisphosphate aldolase class II